MKHDPITQAHLLPLLQDDAFGLVTTDKVMHSKGIGGKQTVGAHVPATGITKALGVIMNRDADRFPINRSRVVDPGRLVAPSFFVVLPLPRW